MADDLKPKFRPDMTEKEVQAEMRRFIDEVVRQSIGEEPAPEPPPKEFPYRAMTEAEVRHFVWAVETLATLHSKETDRLVALDTTEMSREKKMAHSLMFDRSILMAKEVRKVLQMLEKVLNGKQLRVPEDPWLQ